MKQYEKLGTFYLGRILDGATGETKPESLLYDARDLTTHAVCLGMTGSGKTGLCISLLEEAALDGVPVIAIDPKGDLGNLMLTFPELRPADFRPWVDSGEAARKGLTPDQYAVKVADLWRNGLASWDQDGDRIARFRKAADVAIYTPGSSAGIPISVLRSLSAPPAEIMDDSEALGERVLSAVSGLLTLIGVKADPIRSREHILLSTLLHRAWSEGRPVEIAQLIRDIQSPPLQRVGVLDLDSFYPAKDRFELAMGFNNLLASPGFASWMEGEPLEIPRLLRTPEGKPKISILSIAHLPDAQRMFFVTLVLNELVAWVRTQSGTTSLRCILYMDEVYGYFPPSADPPSKAPMLTLLKQARAFGLGCVLATQNPVDLDYKGLSNAGTWFLGRLQTERDKARVIDGLEGASASTGAAFNRRKMEETLAGLKSRVFLMNNVHDDGPVLFHTRWAMSYLRGPLTRNEIRRLMSGRPAEEPAAAKPVREKAAPDVARAAGEKDAAARPVVAAGVTERFLPPGREMDEGETLVYRPALLGAAKLHFVSARDKLDYWQDEVLLAPASETANPWTEGEPVDITARELWKKGERGGRFAALPSRATKAGSYTSWAKALKGELYRSHTITLWKCAALKETSLPGEGEGEFRSRLSQIAREQRDLTVEKLRARYGPKLARLHDRIRTAENRVDREQSQQKNQKVQSAISLGATLLGAVFGRKIASAGNVGRAATAARGIGRAAREADDVARARESLEVLRQKLADLEVKFEDDTANLQESFDLESLELTAKEIRPRKADIEVEPITLVWTPWGVDGDGIAEPAGH